VLHGFCCKFTWLYSSERILIINPSKIDKVIAMSLVYYVFWNTVYVASGRPSDFRPQHFLRKVYAIEHRKLFCKQRVVRVVVISVVDVVASVLVLVSVVVVSAEVVLVSVVVVSMVSVVVVSV